MGCSAKFALRHLRLQRWLDYDQGGRYVRNDGARNSNRSNLEIAMKCSAHFSVDGPHFNAARFSSLLPSSCRGSTTARKRNRYPGSQEIESFWRSDSIAIDLPDTADVLLHYVQSFAAISEHVGGCSGTDVMLNIVFEFCDEESPVGVFVSQETVAELFAIGASIDVDYVPSTDS